MTQTTNVLMRDLYLLLGTTKLKNISPLYLHVDYDYYPHVFATEFEPEIEEEFEFSSIKLLERATFVDGDGYTLYAEKFTDITWDITETQENLIWDELKKQARGYLND